MEKSKKDVTGYVYDNAEFCGSINKSPSKFSLIMNKFLLQILAIFFFPHFSEAQALPGSLDSTFNNTGISLVQADGHITSIEKVLVQPDGKYLLIGHIQSDTLPLRYRTVVIRYNSDGTLDSTYSNDGTNVLNNRVSVGFSAILMDDGSLVTVGTGLYPNHISFCKVDANGKIDSTFGNNGLFFRGVNGFNYPNVVKVYKDTLNRVLIVGIGKIPSTSNWRGFVARFTPDFKVDSTFNGIGAVGIPESNAAFTQDIRGGGVLPDGRVMITGSVGSTALNTSWLLARFNTDGTPDTTFGTGGVVKKNMGNSQFEGCADVHFLPDGNFIAGGYSQKGTGFHFTLARFSENGTYDLTYGFAGKAQITLNCCFSEINEIAEQADGKIVACGQSSQDNVHHNFAVARFNPDGSVDQGFGNSGGLILQFEPDTIQLARSLAIQNDGKILVAGYTTAVGNFAGTSILVRLNPGPVTVNVENLYTGPTIENLKVAPNPVSGNTLQLEYALEEESAISLHLFDLTGRKVKTFYQNQTRQEGEQTERVELPETLVPGVYYLTLSTGGKAISVKMVKLP